MPPLLYATSNPIKFQQAAETCQRYGIDLHMETFDSTELQTNNAEVVARDKATKAYQHFLQPVVVSDDYWIIPGLNGFPGSYMHDIDQWFGVDDWLRLTHDLDDRTIILRSTVVYQDMESSNVFSADLHGILLPEARGKSPYAHAHIVSMDGGEFSNAEHHAAGRTVTVGKYNVWVDLAEWYVKRNATEQ